MVVEASTTAARKVWAVTFRNREIVSLWLEAELIGAQGRQVRLLPFGTFFCAFPEPEITMIGAHKSVAWSKMKTKQSQVEEREKHCKE